MGCWQLSYVINASGQEDSRGSTLSVWLPVSSLSAHSSAECFSHDTKFLNSNSDCNFDNPIFRYFEFRSFDILNFDILIFWISIFWYFEFRYFEFRYFKFRCFDILNFDILIFWISIFRYFEFRYFDSLNFDILIFLNYRGEDSLC